MDFMLTTLCSVLSRAESTARLSVLLGNHLIHIKCLICACSFFEAILLFLETITISHQPCAQDRNHLLSSAQNKSNVTSFQQIQPFPIHQPLARK